MSVANKLFLFTVLFICMSGVVKAADYILGAGDVIEISVYQQPDLSLQKTLTTTGEISFPYIGVVNLAGTTEFQAEALLEKKLIGTQLIKNPDVTIRIREHRSRIALVEGKVAKPGEYPIIGELTARQLIARAGGLLDGANPEVIIFRKGAALQKFDLYKIYKAGESKKEFKIKHGDLVMIESETTPVFYTYGAVNKAGRYEFVSGMSVVQALAISGGLSEDASEKNIKIIRDSSNRPGSSETLEIDASLTDKIQMNDVIKVRESRF